MGRAPSRSQYGSQLFTYARSPPDVPGWTCAAHESKPSTRIVAPASEVTVETAVGTPLRNAPWPDFDNGMLNATFGGVQGERLVDSSFLGNIAYTGDYFLRVPRNERKWIAHAADDGYIAVHGHPLAGTKFFTWGQSGPGRFMQDFLAGGVSGGGDYTELQAGVTPTQQQVFTLDANTSLGFTEYYKPLRRPSALPTAYPDAVQAVGGWLDSADGIPQAKVRAMDDFFNALSSRPVQRAELVSTGSGWGALHEELRGQRLSSGASFFATDDAEGALWRELASNGTFTAATLAGTRAPLSYATDPLWVRALETSAQRGQTWLHSLLLAVAYIEGGEVDRPRAMLRAALAPSRSPIVARTLAVLETSAEDAWPLYELAWNLTLAPPPTAEPADVTQRLRQNVADEILQFTLGHLPGIATGAADTSSSWFARLRKMEAAARAAVGGGGSDTILLASAAVYASSGEHQAALQVLASNCFPTLGRGRDVLISLWRASVEGSAAMQKGRPLTPVEKHQARRAKPVPRSIGCPYATLYCEQYW